MKSGRLGSLDALRLLAVAISRPRAFLGERLQALGPYVLGIYLVHSLVVRLLIVVFGLPTASLWGMLAIACVAWAGSFVAVFVLWCFGWTRRLASIG